MKSILHAILLGMLLNSQVSQSQVVDTLVNIGTHKLHFKIIKGKGMPILFEAGSQDKVLVWDNILKPIAELTGATLITYDRAGFGGSTLDTLEKDISKHGILSGIEDLEIALKKLGYNKQIVLVSHSYGGYYTTLYADRHPHLVKSIVLIDVNHNFHDAEKDMREHEQEAIEWKKNNIAFYYMAVNLGETTKLLSTVSIPSHIPVVDIVNGISPFDDKEKAEYWKECHKKFVDSHPNSIGITAYGCGHYIWFQNPGLVITTIAKSYAETLEEKQKMIVYNRALNYAIVASSEALMYTHLENHLNSWGYELLGKGENAKALEIFKLNITLNPLSSNAYDSYGEALLKDNQKVNAIEMYKKSIALDPENEDGKKILEELLKQK